MQTNVSQLFGFQGPIFFKVILGTDVGLPSFYLKEIRLKNACNLLSTVIFKIKAQYFSRNKGIYLDPHFLFDSKS